ncbi:PREDICTED: zinc finger BED domain-containing protein RICESLEEPER 3-like [Ipomoea nil]|uniref:zinc finger BED domain-containing protein RICESLEEPER 3-like n=1 Tax=Ipomoea nil TaxID=35883 RepID=UPI000900FB0C|nr:PREDICTED: zinc finger BED domain-containing protein RICESLEEPER 3-like [Ipomoea nil]
MGGGDAPSATQAELPNDSSMPDEIAVDPLIDLTTNNNEIEGAPNGPSDSKRLKSVVWEHFTKKVVNGVDKAECNYCKKLLGGQSKNGTKHLHDHHRSCKMKPIQNLKQQTLLQQQWKADGKMGLSTFKFNPEVTRRELACMIIMHEYPLAIVDHEGFRRYTASLQPLFDIPSRNTVKADWKDAYGTIYDDCGISHEELEDMEIEEEDCEG